MTQEYEVRQSEADYKILSQLVLSEAELARVNRIKQSLTTN